VLTELMQNLCITKVAKSDWQRV